MNDPVKVAVIYYSATGNVYRLALEAVEGAEQAGAEARLRKAHELAPPEAIRSNPEWAAHAHATGHVREATLDDLDWADVVLLGTPTRYGGVAAQLKQFVDATGPLWQQGRLANKIYGVFVSTATPHGGQESTLLSLGNVFYHWGGIIVPPGYTDATRYRIGNPYGTSHLATSGAPGAPELDAIRYQVERAVGVARRLKAAPEAPASGAAA